MSKPGSTRGSLQCQIKTWRQFNRRVRAKGCRLLGRLDDFPNSILVTGCQRSGTTILSRIITQSEGMVNYWFGRDDELDAALILSGHAKYLSVAVGRYCFQTTYLNECFNEYFGHINGHKGHRIIWVLRNPYSVVYSMLHNWRTSALNRLFKGCGKDLLSDSKKGRYEWLGSLAVSKLERACLSYCGKVSQLFELKRQLKDERIMVVEYDELTSKKQELLPLVYEFICLNYRPEYADKLNSASLNRRSLLSKREYAMIESQCISIYEEARRLVNNL